MPFSKGESVGETRLLAMPGHFGSPAHYGHYGHLDTQISLDSKQKIIGRVLAEIQGESEVWDIM